MLTQPDDAEIRLLNVEQEYKENIVLEVGRYHVELSRPGHVTLRTWINSFRKTTRIHILKWIQFNFL